MKYLLGIDFGGGDIRVVPITVLATPVAVKKHYVCKDGVQEIIFPVEF